MKGEYKYKQDTFFYESYDNKMLEKMIAMNKNEMKKYLKKADQNDKEINKIFNQLKQYKEHSITIDEIQMNYKHSQFDRNGTERRYCIERRMQGFHKPIRGAIAN